MEEMGVKHNQADSSYECIQDGKLTVYLTDWGVITVNIKRGHPPVNIRILVPIRYVPCQGALAAALLCWVVRSERVRRFLVHTRR